MITNIKKQLYKNSELFKNQKIGLKIIFNKNIIQTGGKNLTIDYKNHKYTFEKFDIDEDNYVLYSLDNLECVSIIISKEYKTAEIHGISNYKSCLQFTNENIGSTLLKLTIRMLKKYKERFGINMIILTDNSIKKCIKENIILSIMLSLLTGNTWYGKYGFRPIEIQNNKYIVDDISNNKYNENYKIMNSLKITDFDLLKYIKLTNNQKLIDATQRIIKDFPLMLLKDFLGNLIKNYDKTCSDFAKFYRKLYNDIGVFDPYHKLYGLAI